ncbi:MAG: hypothetical protein LKM45_00165, partial [Wolbachia endosymbiont of Alcedoecus sp.]|nr:hypothetical protein [Wolbachia endosymbiont of Alcedoecus sp.]
MPKELLQMNQLEKFYSLIANSRVKIRFTSRSDNYMSFEVKGSHESAVNPNYGLANKERSRNGEL